MPNPQPLLALIILLTLILLLPQSSCRNLHYVLTLQSTSYYKCYRQSGLDSVILSLQQTYPQISQTEVQNFVNAKNAGLNVEVVFVPCRLRTPQEEIDFIVWSVGVGVIGRFWVFPTDDGTECSWAKYSAQSNCLYLQKLIQISSTKHNISLNIAADVIFMDYYVIIRIWLVVVMVLWGFLHDSTRIEMLGCGADQSRLIGGQGGRPGQE